MSVLRQLLLSVTVAIIAMLIGTLIFSINGARDYLSAQLQAESDNAATSLALSLSQPSNQDPVLRELLVTALFDSGQFQAIELHDVHGNELVARRISSAATVRAPDWFVRLLPLRAPHATRQVSDGWAQVGALTVIADASDAKNALWRSSIQIFGWVILAGALWLIFVVLLMRWLKRALRDEITKQVDSVVEGHAVAPGKAHSRIADLIPSSDVMTQARERVQASKQEAVNRIESLTLELNHDPVTGLPNRRYFMNELRRALQQGGADDSSVASGGYLLLCRQRDLASLAAALPRDEVDGWLRSVGERLQQALDTFGESTVHLGRLNGPDFAILIPNVQGPKAMLVGQTVRRTLLAMGMKVGAGQPCRWAFAMTDFIAGDDLSAVFSRLDTALMKAESAGHRDIETLLRAQFDGAATERIVSEQAWRTLLVGALTDRRVKLSVTPVGYGRDPQARARHEATLSISDPAHHQGEVLSGFSFMPAAVRLGMSADFDLRAIELALRWLDQHPGDLVVRISVSSLLKPDFTQAVRRLLEPGAPEPGDQGALSGPGALCQRLVLELDAYGLSAYPADVEELCRIARQAGVRVGLRGVAQQLDTVARLQGLSLSYIKLGGGFIADLESSQGALSLLNAVIHTAMILKIQVLVDDTPGETAAMLLRDHGALLRTNG